MERSRTERSRPAWVDRPRQLGARALALVCLIALGPTALGARGADPIFADGFETGSLLWHENSGMPRLDLDGSTPGTGSAATYTEGDAPIAIVAGDATLTDADDTHLVALTATLTNLLDVGDETLAVDTTGTAILANWSPGTGTLSLAGSDTVANYQQVLRTITYENADTDPDAHPRTVQIVAADSTSPGLPAVATLTIVLVEPSSEDPSVPALTTGVSVLSLGQRVVPGLWLHTTQFYFRRGPGLGSSWMQQSDLSMFGLTLESFVASHPGVPESFVLSGRLFANILLYHFTPPAAVSNRTLASTTDPPLGLVVDPAGDDVFVARAVADGGGIARRSRSSVPTANLVFATSGPGDIDVPGALAIGPGGRLYALDPSGGRVVVFDHATGLFLDDFPLVDPTAASALAVDARGYLYTADGAGGASVYDTATGTRFGRFTSAVVDPELGKATLTVDDDYLYLFDPATGFHIWDIGFTGPSDNGRPRLDLDPNTSGTGHTATYTEGDPPVALVAAGATLDDADDSHLVALTATLTNLLDSGDEALAADTSGTAIVATWSPGSGTLSLTGYDTVAHYQQVLRTLTYTNADDDPDAHERIVTLVAADSSGAGQTAVATVAVELVEVSSEDPSLPSLDPLEGVIGLARGPEAEAVKLFTTETYYERAPGTGSSWTPTGVDLAGDIPLSLDSFVDENDLAGPASYALTASDMGTVKLYTFEPPATPSNVSLTGLTTLPKGLVTDPANDDLFLARATADNSGGVVRLPNTGVGTPDAEVFGNGLDQVNAPGAIAIGPHRDLYVLDPGAPRVMSFVFTPVGTAVAMAFAETFPLVDPIVPTALAVDARGYLYTADGDGGVSVYDTGTGRRFGRLTSTAVDPELGKATLEVDGDYLYHFDPATGFHIWDIGFVGP